MKIVNFAARPLLEWRIIARHALSLSIPRAKRRAPCGLQGLTAQRGQAKGALHAENGRKRLADTEPIVGLDKWIESSVWGSLPLTRKAPYKVKNRKHPAIYRIMDALS